MHFVKTFFVGVLATSVPGAAASASAEKRQRDQCSDSLRSLSTTQSAFEIVKTTLPMRSQEVAEKLIDELAREYDAVNEICSRFVELAALTQMPGLLQLSDLS
ncbi:hypothetical protein FQN54_001352 [Arachnomyces sp. PD_36]|nr:hypothetical protein FQN54_001352 [Arachnomyces sp. PD_36]